MAITKQRATLEQLKFRECPEGSGEVVVATELCGDSSFSPSGLSTEGRITHVDLDDSTWKALPLVALSDRNAIQIINRDSDIEVYLEFDDTAPVNDGIPIPPGGSILMDITDAIVVYGNAASGTPKLTVVEVS